MCQSGIYAPTPSMLALAHGPIKQHGGVFKTRGFGRDPPTPPPPLGGSDLKKKLARTPPMLDLERGPGKQHGGGYQPNPRYTVVVVVTFDRCFQEHALIWTQAQVQTLQTC